MMTLMLTRRMLAGLCASALALAVVPAKADQAAEAYVQNILDEAAPKLETGNRDEMFSAMENLVSKYVDMRRIGRFTLGQYARQMTDEQAAAYYPLFERYATNIYQNTLTDYAGERLTVVGSVDRSEKDIIVNSRLADPEPGSPYANTVIHWRIYRDANGAMNIVDAGADNVWLAIEQRSQFTSIIANNGGGARGIDALLAELRARVQ